MLYMYKHLSLSLSLSLSQSLSLCTSCGAPLRRKLEALLLHHFKLHILEGSQTLLKHAAAPRTKRMRALAHPCCEEVRAQDRA